MNTAATEDRDALRPTFGSVETFKARFEAAGWELFGSGRVVTGRKRAGFEDRDRPGAPL